MVVSEPNHLDPETWRQTESTPKERTVAFGMFRKVVVEANRCSAENINRYIPFDYTIDDIQFMKSYRDQKGQALVRLGLDYDKYFCDGPTDLEWLPRWILVGDKISDLGTIKDLVDAGDYDKDGKSELIFLFSGYDRGGYIMLYGNEYSKRIDFIWGYH